MNVLRIRNATENDFDDLMEIFSDSISRATLSDYNDEQRKVWIRAGMKRSLWTGKLRTQRFLIAQRDTKTVGFASIEKNNYIDMLYVGNQYQRQGVAQVLFNDLEKTWLHSGQRDLMSDVSITARQFFEKNGFKVVRTNINILEGVELTNFRMIKERL